MTDASLGIEELAAAEVDPDLLILALSRITRARGKRSRSVEGMVVLCAKAYAEFNGLSGTADAATLAESDALVLGGLLLRVTALAVLFESGQVGMDAFDPAALAEAAATARLVVGRGEPHFQLLDFLARAERAAARDFS